MATTEMGRGNEVGKETRGRDNGTEYEEEWMSKETRSCWITLQKDETRRKKAGDGCL
jgi:hypothetical protein